MFNNSVRGEKPFLSIGTPRGVALTSLDKYLGATPRGDNEAPKSPSHLTAVDDISETIASLQREQSRLSEELDAERRRSESLKQTFSKSLSQSASAQREKLLVLKQILETEPDNSYAKEALKYIGNIEEQDENRPVDTPRVSELAQKAKEAELLVEKQHQQNQKLKKTVREALDEIAQLNQQIEEINAQIEAASNSRHELKEKTKSISLTVKKKDSAWKERVAQLEAQLLEQG